MSTNFLLILIQKPSAGLDASAVKERGQQDLAGEGYQAAPTSAAAVCSAGVLQLWLLLELCASAVALYRLSMRFAALWTLLCAWLQSSHSLFEPEHYRTWRCMLSCVSTASPESLSSVALSEHVAALFCCDAVRCMR